MAYDNVTIGTKQKETIYENGTQDSNMIGKFYTSVPTGEVIDGEPVYELRGVNAVLGSRPTSFSKKFTGIVSPASQDFFMINDDPNRTAFIDGRLLEVFNTTGVDSFYDVFIYCAPTSDISDNGDLVGTLANEGSHNFGGFPLENYGVYTGTTFSVAPSWEFLRTKFLSGKLSAETNVIAPIEIPPNSYVGLKYEPSLSTLQFSISLLAKQNVL